MTSSRTRRPSGGQNWLALGLAVLALCVSLMLWSDARADAPATGTTATAAAAASDLPDMIRPGVSKVLAARDWPRAWGHLDVAAKSAAPGLAGPLLAAPALVPVAADNASAAVPARSGPLRESRPSGDMPGGTWLAVTALICAAGLLALAAAPGRRLW